MARVLLGISGGVDSVVAASLLKRDAHDVVGVTLLFDDSDASRIGAEKAAEICKRFDFEHSVVDVSAEYEELVAKPIFEGYAAGLEVNSTVLATQRILLPKLFELSQAARCRFVATGHFANVGSEAPVGDLFPLRLQRAQDKHNDQSFYLNGLEQSQLNRLMFPLGNMQELEVRMHAMRSGLMMPEVPNGDNLYLFGAGAGGTLTQWLAARGLNMPQGDAVDLATGAVVGRHRGLAAITLGERFHTDAERTMTAEELEDEKNRRYIVARDLTLNRAYIGTAAQASAESVRVKDVVWTSIHPLTEKRSCRMRTYRGESPKPVQLVPMDDGSVTMSFTLPQRGLASGKSVVFFSDNIVLGGGTIA